MSKAEALRVLRTELLMRGQPPRLVEALEILTPKPPTPRNQYAGLVKRLAGPATCDEARLYAEAMGKTWNEVDPEPNDVDYNAPVMPKYPDTFAKDGERRAALEAYHKASDAYHTARANWRVSEDGRRYEAALDKWDARRMQFSYSGPKKRLKDDELRVFVGAFIGQTTVENDVPLAA